MHLVNVYPEVSSLLFNPISQSLHPWESHGISAIRVKMNKTNLLLSIPWESFKSHVSGYTCIKMKETAPLYHYIYHNIKKKECLDLIGFRSISTKNSQHSMWTFRISKSARFIKEVIFSADTVPYLVFI